MRQVFRQESWRKENTISKLQNPIKICIIHQQTFFCCCKKQLIGRVAYVQLMLMDMADKVQPPRSNLYKTKCLWCRYSDSTNSKLHNPIKICIICSLLKKTNWERAYVQFMLMNMADKDCVILLNLALLNQYIHM